jgi:hypothetical protein
MLGTRFYVVFGSHEDRLQCAGMKPHSPPIERSTVHGSGEEGDRPAPAREADLAPQLKVDSTATILSIEEPRLSAPDATEANAKRLIRTPVTHMR